MVLLRGIIWLMRSFPIQIAYQALLHNLQQDPGFSWWVKHMIKKRDYSTSAIHTRYAKGTHKFGIQVLVTIEEA